MKHTLDRQGIAAGVLILAIGLSVRYPITSVSALLSSIGTEYGLTAAGLATLTSIPVLLFGLASPLAPFLVSRLGLQRTISLLLALLAVATLLRPLNSELLFLGTVVVGATIALLGILAPQIIRETLPHRVGLWTGIYTTSFGLSAASGAALAIPILHVLDDRVSAALMVWGIPLCISLGLAIAFGPRLGSSLRPTRPNRADRPPSVFRARGLWAVTGFFGCQALIYFTLTSWLPAIAADRGMAAADAGLLLAWMSIAGLPASLLAPLIAARPRLRVPFTAGVAVVSFCGLLSLAFGPIALAPASVALLGLAQSAAFGLSIAFIVFTAPSVRQTASFSAVSQGLGYIFAAAGPLLMGFLAQAGVQWSANLALLAGVAVLEGIFGVLSARTSLTAAALRAPGAG